MITNGPRLDGASACPVCGQALPGNAPHGLCPACLLGALPPDSPPEPEGEGHAGPPPDPKTNPPASGRRFGDYLLMEELGRGGHGVVFKARQVSLDRFVALKLLAFNFLATPASVKRFRLEASAAAALRHPNIVSIHEVGVSEGQHYFAMDWIEGEPLSRRIRDFAYNVSEPAGSLDLASRAFLHKSAARVLRTLADAAHYAHERGILHRDLKPSNVLIDAAGQPHLTDFGLAKRLDEEGDLTLTGEVLGSPSYLPPEQAAGAKGQMGRASDVYSLGAILYHLLTGRPPFVGETVPEILQQVLHSDPLPPRALNPGVPADLETICLKCLEKNPARRYATARALADELDRFLRDEPIAARPVSSIEKARRWCRRRPAAAVALATTGILLLTLGLGSPLVALRLRKSEVATAEGHLAQARALRFGGLPGRRFEALEEIRRAAAMHPPPRLRTELRDEAIACLALTDLRLQQHLPLQPPGTMVCFTPGGHRYVHWTEQGEVGLHDTATGRELRRWKLPRTAFESLRFRGSPDGRRLALEGRELSPPETPGGNSQAGSATAPSSGGLNRSLLVDLDTGTITARSPDPLASHAWPDFSDDGTRVAFGGSAGAGSDRGQVTVHDTATGEELHRVDLLASPKFLAFSPDARRLAISLAPENSVVVVEAATGTVRDEFRFRTPINGVAWHPDGRRVAGAGEGGLVFVWQPGSGLPALERRAHGSDVVLTVAFSHSGELLASSGWDGRLCLSDPDTLDPILEFTGGEGFELRFSEDDRVLTSAHWDARSGRLFEVTSPEILKTRLQPDSGHFPHPLERRLAFSPDNCWLACADDSGVTVWETWRMQSVARLPKAGVTTTFFHPSGSDLFLSGPGGCVRWPLRPGAAGGVAVGPPVVVTRMDPAGGEAGWAAMSADGQTLATSQEWRLWLRDPTNHTVRVRTEPHFDARCLDISRDGRWMADARWGDGPMCVWSAETGALVANLGASVYPCFLPAGRELLCWSEATNSWVHELYGVGSWKNPRPVNVQLSGWSPPLSFAPNGRVFAHNELPGELRLKEWPGAATLLRLQSGDRTSHFTSVEWSRDGARLAAWRDSGRVEVWHLGRLETRLAEIGLGNGRPAAPSTENPVPRTGTWEVLLPGRHGSPPAIPPRDPAAPARLVDLSRHFNAALNADWYPGWTGDWGDDLAEVPAGVRTLGGVDYDLRGLVQVGDSRFEGNPFPVAVPGIGIGQMARTLHLLHAAIRGQSARPGEEIGAYTVHYADGQSVRIPLRMGANIGDWWEDGQANPSAAEPVWRGANTATRQRGNRGVRLLHFGWQNPRPDVALSSLDLEWLGHGAAPFLVAVTAE